ncbi:MAG: response regulator [Candidatus Eisenbacteria bacterium]|nr:response regulator [Candidatus Latescibacterota bacterium]MBD3301033.1 response regulator [Candidatus Eisenbacteria bacterium]
MPKLLIVDDDPNLLRLYREELEEEGYEVEVAAGAREAVEAFDRTSFDCVVLDVQLAEGNGLALLRRFLDLRTEVPVVLNTAYAFFKNDFSTWSAAAYVVKSSDLSELKAVVRGAIPPKAA